MKFYIIFLLTLFLSGFAYSQSADSSNTKSQREEEKKQRMDRFIDEDGDGISDHRAEGLGFGRQKKMHGKKQQPVQARQEGATGATQSQGENKGTVQQRGRRK